MIRLASIIMILALLSGCSPDTSKQTQTGYASVDLDRQRYLECQWHLYMPEPDDFCWDLAEPFLILQDSENAGEQVATAENLSDLISPKSLLLNHLGASINRSREEEQHLADSYAYFEFATSSVDGFWSTVIVRERPSSYGCKEIFSCFGGKDLAGVRGSFAKKLPRPNEETFTARRESDSNWLKNWKSEIHRSHSLQLTLDDSYPVQEFKCVWDGGKCFGLMGTRLVFHIPKSAGSPFWSDQEAPMRSMRFSLIGDALDDLRWDKGQSDYVYPGYYRFPGPEAGLGEYPATTSFADEKLAYSSLWATRSRLEEAIGGKIYEGDIVTVVGRPVSVVLEALNGHDHRHLRERNGLVLTDVESISAEEAQTCNTVTDGFCVPSSCGLLAGGNMCRRVKMNDTVYLVYPNDIF